MRAPAGTIDPVQMRRQALCYHHDSVWARPGFSFFSAADDGRCRRVVRPFRSPRPTNRPGRSLARRRARGGAPKANADTRRAFGGSVRPIRRRDHDHNPACPSRPIPGPGRHDLERLRLWRAFLSRRRRDRTLARGFPAIYGRPHSKRRGRRLRSLPVSPRLRLGRPLDGYDDAESLAQRPEFVSYFDLDLRRWKRNRVRLKSGFSPVTSSATACQIKGAYMGP